MLNQGVDMEISVFITNKDGEKICEKSGVNEVNLFYGEEYEEGAEINVSIDCVPCFVWLKVDDSFDRSLVYVTGDVAYKVPFGEKRANLSPKAFCGNRHLISVRKAMDFEINAYRNLALNTSDCHTVKNLYPHATANVETRGESVFAAQNAINGNTANESHGEWPYESWGINRQDDACIRIDFGREVTVERVVLYTRADFPHDNWWEQVHLDFSDGSDETLELEKSTAPHEFKISPRTITWIEMNNMKKADDPSPFPALTQIEVYGN